jgi:hypothetical protein
MMNNSVKPTYEFDRIYSPIEIKGVPALGGRSGENAKKL